MFERHTNLRVPCIGLRHGPARTPHRLPSLLAALWFAFCGPAMAFDHAAYRTDLVALMQVLDDLHVRAGPEAPGSRAQIERAQRMFAAFDDASVESLARTLPLARLHALVTQSQRLLQVRPPARGKTVSVAQPDVTPGFCTDYPAPVSLAALGTKIIAEHVIEGLEFTCHESIGGFNAALLCEAPEITAAAAEIASQLAGFCGDQQTAAANTAVLFTERSIGRHLDDELDAVLSTRATQVSVDAAGQDLAQGDDTLRQLHTDYSEDVAAIDAQIDDAAQQLGALIQTLTDVQSVSADLAMRIQVSQVDVEDAQQRGADAHELAVQLTDLMLTQRALAADLGAEAAALAPAIDAGARQQRRDDLAAALGDPDARIAGLALPAAAGGRIEEAREVLIAAITVLQTLGQGDTAQALQRLTGGDAHYNAGRYTDAWREFSAAYRSLDPHAAGGAP